MIRTVQVTSVSFDLSLDEDDAWELDDPELLQAQLQGSYVGQVLEVEVSDRATDTEVAEELCEELSCCSGWCINSIDFRYVLQ